ncbi:unnamed protein product [Cylindrotheca closterium]|uniref:Uncharacterized protein n=1 Tax=Cylindrotheca closterium TaxID=2856 RepID=A0AAD2GC67_9STRA|nr:unnamed protein product [Cylindrotheca closterium]
MADITEQSRKRGRSEFNESGDGQVKLAKRSLLVENNGSFADPQSFIPTTPKNSFLRLHLQILRSLYTADSLETQFEGQRDDLVDVKDDGEVQEDVFGTIEQFLKQRRQLGGLVNAVKLNKAVHDEAAKYQSEDIQAEQYPLTPSTVPKNEVTNSILARSSVIPLSSQQSPYGQRFLSGSYRTGLSQSSNGGSNLLAALLKRKYLLADRALRRETHVFQELLSNVKERIEIIESLLEEQLKAPGLQSLGGGTENLTPNASSNARVHENEYRSEMVAKLETKQRLWAMLLQDMETAYGS